MTRRVISSAKQLKIRRKKWTRQVVLQHSKSVVMTCLHVSCLHAAGRIAQCCPATAPAIGHVPNCPVSAQQLSGTGFLTVICLSVSTQAAESTHYCLQLRANGEKDIDDIRTLMEEVDMRIAGSSLASLCQSKPASMALKPSIRQAVLAASACHIHGIKGAVPISRDQCHHPLVLLYNSDGTCSFAALLCGLLLECTTSTSVPPSTHELLHKHGCGNV